MNIQLIQFVTFLSPKRWRSPFLVFAHPCVFCFCLCTIEGINPTNHFIEILYSTLFDKSCVFSILKYTSYKKTLCFFPLYGSLFEAFNMARVTKKQTCPIQPPGFPTVRRGCEVSPSWNTFVPKPRFQSIRDLAVFTEILRPKT